MVARTTDSKLVRGQRIIEAARISKDAIHIGNTELPGPYWTDLNVTSHGDNSIKELTITFFVEDVKIDPGVESDPMINVLWHLDSHPLTFKHIDED